MRAKSVVKASALAIGFGALLAGTVPAGDFAAAAKGKKAKDDTSRRVCRVITPTGSRMTTRICKTQAEWDNSQDKTQDGVLRHQMNETTLLERAAGPR